MGTHLNGSVVGGWAVDGKVKATGINSVNGSSTETDISPDDTLQAYFRTMMDVAGVPHERQDLRLPTGRVVSSVIL